MALTTLPNVSNEVESHKYRFTNGIKLVKTQADVLVTALHFRLLEAELDAAVVCPPEIGGTAGTSELVAVADAVVDILRSDRAKVIAACSG